MYPFNFQTCLVIFYVHQSSAIAAPVLLEWADHSPILMEDKQSVLRNQIGGNWDLTAYYFNRTDGCMDNSSAKCRPHIVKMGVKLKAS